MIADHVPDGRLDSKLRGIPAWTTKSRQFERGDPSRQEDMEFSVHNVIEGVALALIRNVDSSSTQSVQRHHLLRKDLSMAPAKLNTPINSPMHATLGELF